jgi:hypothetical protein
VQQDSPLNASVAHSGRLRCWLSQSTSKAKKECATTSIVSLQERDCIAKLRGTREAQLPISRQRSAGTAPASATSSRGMAGTDALGHVLPKRRADERRRRCRPKRRLSDPALTQKVRSLIMDRHWSLEEIDNISGSRVAAGAPLSLPTTLQVGP